MYREVQPGRKFIGRFNFKDDLLLALTSFCKNKNIKLGRFEVIGALKSVKLGYYDKENKEYVECVNLEKTLEITSCMGNISLNQGEVFIHAHITLADHQGKCFGGHLMQGAEIFAAEYVIEEFIGAPLERKDDEKTGLRLW